MAHKPLDLISVIVPENPFPPGSEKNPLSRCLCALDVELHLMKWWPGEPHKPEKAAEKVRAIQRMLDWKRVAHIAAYLLQEDLNDVARDIEKHFGPIYGSKKGEPGREWPPKVPNLIKHKKSAYPEFADILVHVNGATLRPVNNKKKAYHLLIDSKDPGFRFSVIDGQHRVNGAYLALKILQARKKNPKIKMDLPATVYLDLDVVDGAPKNQAQLFIDVNFNQKKVDRSLVFDLFPTARDRSPQDDYERSMDLGRILMLETGPLVGMIQIPGIRYGVKGVVTLATLSGAIQGVINSLDKAGLTGLHLQADFLAQMLSSWLNATGWRETDAVAKGEVDPESVVYQGRILVSVIALIPAALQYLHSQKITFVSEDASQALESWAKGIIARADLEHGGRFINRKQFRSVGFLGSGGIARFRNLLWAATDPKFKVRDSSPEKNEAAAAGQSARVYQELDGIVKR